VLVSLAAASKSKGWWQSYGDAVPEWFELYVGLEAAALRVRNYESALVPGLLQTREYAEVVVDTVPDISEAEVARRVAVRLERQKLLARSAPGPLRLEVIINEAVLRRQLADRATMRGQLARLAGAAKIPDVDLRVVPLSARPHHTLVTGAFVILEFPTTGARPAEPTTVYSEGLTGALYLDRPQEVDAFETAWAMLGDTALDVDDSADMINTIIKEEY
jgi:Domain of unknown function (DUF5753)